MSTPQIKTSLPRCNRRCNFTVRRYTALSLHLSTLKTLCWPVGNSEAGAWDRDSTATIQRQLSRNLRFKACGIMTPTLSSGAPEASTLAPRRGESAGRRERRVPSRPPNRPARAVPGFHGWPCLGRRLFPPEYSPLLNRPPSAREYRRQRRRYEDRRGLLRYAVYPYEMATCSLPCPTDGG